MLQMFSAVCYASSAATHTLSDAAGHSVLSAQLIEVAQRAEGIQHKRVLCTSFEVTDRQHAPSCARRFCLLVLGPCGLHSGMLVLASPASDVI